MIVTVFGGKVQIGDTMGQRWYTERQITHEKKMISNSDCTIEFVKV